MRPLLLVCGTRPEAVKLAPVARALSARGLPWRLLAAGQHGALLDRALTSMGLRPHRRLRLMSSGQTPSRVASEGVRRIGAVIAAERPPLVVVQGDTTTAAAAAWAACYAKVPLAHVEAGLRTGDLLDPHPEEVNRLVIDRLASLHLAPTEEGARNLSREGIAGAVVTGNTAVDAARWAAGRAAAARLAAPTVLLTLHRREILGLPLTALLRAVSRALTSAPGTRAVLPVHPNPAVRAAVRAAERLPGIDVRAPLDYLPCIALLRACLFVVTDSGSLQEEASALGKAVVVAREKTERPELLKAGGALLGGRSPAPLEAAVRRLLGDATLRRRLERAPCPFGDGRAGERCAAAIARFLRGRN
ncbi:MAG: UDP-N-acetylglucosamine 2-epimerase (non-hydrolyzing) [Elusimicrobia bacterium]|nr:UDP-N-acetylglucosamine 2-epimerase (non-hydrolyzing) [Elusimicrobiota bacterium]